MVEPRSLCGLSNNVEMRVSEIVKGIGLAEPEKTEREKHSYGFNFRFMETVKAFRRVIRRWWVRFFVLIRLKSA